MNKEFKKGFGKSDCVWCNFVEVFYSGNKISEINVPKADEE